MSVAGGIHNAIDHIIKVGGTALQIFTRNQRQWKAKPLSQKEISDFIKKRKTAGIRHVASHASYLVNLASKKVDQIEKSISAMADELWRCHHLGIDWIVVHPGSHGGAGRVGGLKQATESIDAIFELAGPMVKNGILLETTAGQGTSLGAIFEDLEYILGASKYPERLGICVDTCHIFAAGYDISNKNAYRNTFELFDKIVGLKRIKMFHLNDSKKALGSCIDRHEHIGKGKIGLKGFALLLNDERFRHVPMVLETPKSKDLSADVKNLEVLKGLIHNVD